MLSAPNVLIFPQITPSDVVFIFPVFITSVVHQVSSDVKSIEFDILEQSLRAADVLADYPNTAGLSLQGRSLSLPCTPVSSSSIAPSVTHPLVDCALDDTQQQRLNNRRLQRNNNYDNNNNKNNAVMGRHSLSDIVTPTSDATTASSPSECFSQVTSLSVPLSVCLSVYLSVCQPDFIRFS